MKLRNIFILFFILTVCSIGNAQVLRISSLEEISMKPRPGIRTGGSLTKLFNGEEDTNYRLGFSIGGVLKTPLSKTLSLQNELVFSKKGGSITYLTNNYYTGDVRYNLYYIDLPVLLKVKLSPLFNLVWGYQGSLLVDANIEYVDPYVVGIAELDENQLNKWDNSLVLGLSIGGRKRAFDVRLNYGLTDIAKSNYANTFLGNAKNLSVQFCFTRYFGFR